MCSLRILLLRSSSQRANRFRGIGVNKGSRKRLGIWEALSDAQQNLSLRQKWDIIAATNGGTRWQPGREPFQSCELIFALRNELVHFKGRVLSLDEIPVNKIKGLMNRFKLQTRHSKASIRVNTWVPDLLTARQLGKWVAEVSRQPRSEHRFVPHGQTAPKTH
jgi:hypothetical protein